MIFSAHLLNTKYVSERFVNEDPIGVHFISDLSKIL